MRREGRLTGAQREALETLYPIHGIAVDDTLIDLAKTFVREARRCVEIGYGNGDTLLWHAERFSQVDFLGIEVYPPGVGQALRGIQARALRNVRVLQQDAVEVFEHRLGEACVDRVMVLFPDPWPKKRHHKRRIIQPAFLSLIARALRTDGVLHMATDWAPYAEWMAQMADAHAAFTPICEPAALAAATQRPSTRFERRGQRLGHDVVDLAYRKA